MQKILALWGVPRSTSTAFEWMMRQRGDLICFHEPFGEAWYQGENPLWPRVTETSIRIPGLTLQSAWENLQNAATASPVFIKDFPHYVDSLWDAEFLSAFNHSFLIRDPAKSIMSMYKHFPDFHLKESGFIEQRQMFDLLCDLHGTPAPVLDSDDLLEDPHQMVKAWCDAVGIPFLADALRWEPGERDSVSWWDGGSFHANLRGSDGLKPQQRTYVDISEAPDRIKKIYDLVLPHYEYMKSFSLVKN